MDPRWLMASVEGHKMTRLSLHTRKSCIMMTVMLEKKTIICEEKKRMMIMMVTMSFGFITNSYKPSTSFLLVASLGAAMVSFYSWVWFQLRTCLVLWMSTWVMAESWNTIMMRPRDIQRPAEEHDQEPSMRQHNYGREMAEKTRKRPRSKYLGLRKPRFGWHDPVSDDGRPNEWQPAELW